MLDQGLPERFQVTFRQHYPSVLRKLMLLVGDRMIAEDLAQEVFLRLYRQPPDDILAVGAWLHRVTTRIAYDFIRQKSQRKRLEDREAAHSFPEASEPPSDLAAMRNYDRETVKRVLQQLSERDRQALLLRYSGYSYLGIASIIGGGSGSWPPRRRSCGTQARWVYAGAVSVSGLADSRRVGSFVRCGHVLGSCCHLNMGAAQAALDKVGLVTSLIIPSNALYYRMVYEHRIGKTRRIWSLIVCTRVAIVEDVS